LHCSWQRGQRTQAQGIVDGDTFNPKTSTPREIARALFGQLQPYRGKEEKVAREFLAVIKEHKAEILEASNGS
jgi:hypothetical protein